MGFTSRKTYNLIPHDKLKNSRDFWRGCVDGDGCLHFVQTNKQKYWTIDLVGTSDTCLEFRNYILMNNIENQRNIIKANSNNLYRLCYASKIAKQVSSLLYKDASVYLERKYQKYLKIQEFHK